ncbi:hypothetical protein CDIK_3180 [Cucumispora dikerogammari]|nr:hypothetical protein CDIK_3180 [Cucumispora dikerogammari]
MSSIASMYDIKYQTISSIIRKYLRTGLVIPEKIGGDRRTKLPPHVKNALLTYIDAECTKTLKELAEYIQATYDSKVSESTWIEHSVLFHFTLKRVTLVPERRNCPNTIASRTEYAVGYRVLETTNDNKNFIFLDEVGFAVVTRPTGAEV